MNGLTPWMDTSQPALHPSVWQLPFFFSTLLEFPDDVSPSTCDILLPVVTLVFCCFLLMTLKDFYQPL
jgi:hypothetical protein